jgi:hypothetical protein
LCLNLLLAYFLFNAQGNIGSLTNPDESECNDTTITLNVESVLVAGDIALMRFLLTYFSF